MTMMKSCLTAVETAIYRQYKRFHEIELTKVIQEETESARSHNIDGLWEDQIVMGLLADEENIKQAMSWRGISVRPLFS